MAPYDRTDYTNIPTIDDEVREQEREVFQFRSVEKYIPREGNYE